MRTNERPRYRNGENANVNADRNKHQKRTRSKSPGPIASNIRSNCKLALKSNLNLSMSFSKPNEADCGSSNLQRTNSKSKLSKGEERADRKLWTLRVVEIAFDLITRYMSMIAKFYYDDSGHGPMRRFFTGSSTTLLPPFRVIAFLIIGFLLSMILVFVLGDDYAVGRDTKIVNATEFPISIAFRNVGCKIRGIEKPILEGITGEIHQGRFTGILGRSGSGKTTLAHSFLGRTTKWCNPALGYVYTNGYRRDLDAIPDRVGYVPQDDVLYPELTVEEALMFSANWRLHKGVDNEMKQIILNKTLNILGLQHVRHSRIGKGENGLSGGERKRVSIGMEMVSRPSILVMDEPTTGLDSAASWRLMKILRKIADSGVSVIAVVHQPSTRVYNLFHDILVLEKGQSVYVGPRKGVFNYFGRLGYNVSSMRNPSEFLLDIVVGLEHPIPGSIAQKHYNNSLKQNVLGSLWKEHGKTNEIWRDIEVRMQGSREKETLILKKLHGEQVPVSLHHNQVDYCEESYPSVFRFVCLAHSGFQQSYYTLQAKPGLLPQSWLWFVLFLKLVWRRGFIYDLLTVTGLASIIAFSRSYSKTWNRKPLSNFFMSVTLGLIGMVGAVFNDEVGPVRRAASSGMMLGAHEFAHISMCILRSLITSRVFSYTYLLFMYFRQGAWYDRWKTFEFMHLVFLTHLCAQGIGSLVCVLVDHDMAQGYVGCILMLVYAHFFALYTPSKDQIDNNSMIFGMVNTAPIVNGLCSVSYARYFMEAILLWEPDTKSDPVGRNFVIRYFNYHEEHKTFCLTCIFAIWSATVLIRVVIFMIANASTQHHFLLPLFFAFILKVVAANAVALITMTIIHEWPRLRSAWERTVIEFNDHHYSCQSKCDEVEDENVDILN